MNFLDKFLNGITMYKLVLYGLICIALISIALSYFEILGYAWPVSSMIFSLIVLFVVCYTVNFIFAKILGIPINSESSYISAIILFLIMPPASTGKELLILAIAGLIAMSSKYLMAPFKKHIFNPAAFSAFVLYASSTTAAVWWVGDPAMIPFLLILGFLIVRKIKRFAMLFSFAGTWLVSLYIFAGPIFSTFDSFRFAFGPILFFSTVMLTEPITTPPTRKLQIIYGALAGFMLNLNFRIFSLFATPEVVLVILNIFSYAASFKRRLILSLVEKKSIAKDIYEFVFSPDANFSYLPGQYLEYTLAHEKTDIRGNRRFFTIASSPTEGSIKLGVKFNEPPSSFKTKLFAFNSGDKIIAGQLGGDFTMPNIPSKKLVFLAGGIGITPFRSMIKYLIDKKEKRDIVLFYAAKTEDEVAYRDIFLEAENKIGLKTKYIIGNLVTEELLKSEVPDFKERIFYISGPELMVGAFKKILLKMGVSRINIVTDYFPGFV